MKTIEPRGSVGADNEYSGFQATDGADACLGRGDAQRIHEVGERLRVAAQEAQDAACGAWRCQRCGRPWRNGGSYCSSCGCNALPIRSGAARDVAEGSETDAGRAVGDGGAARGAPGAGAEGVAHAVSQVAGLIADVAAQVDGPSGSVIELVRARVREQRPLRDKRVNAARMLDRLQFELGRARRSLDRDSTTARLEESIADLSLAADNVDAALCALVAELIVRGAP